MAFWSNETLLRRIQAEGIIEEFKDYRVKYCAYELELGNEVFITSGKERTKQVIAPGGQIIIPPGQFAVLITNEVVTVPNDAFALISIKASIKFLGLINVSGFHVDPGFKGRLKFSVHNAGPHYIALASGDPVFLIFFADLDKVAVPAYAGEHQGQMVITAREVTNLQGEVASPAALDERIKKIELQIEIWTRIIQGFLVAIVLLLLGLLVKSCTSRDSEFPKPGMTTNTLRGSVTITQQTAPGFPVQTRPLAGVGSQTMANVATQQTRPSLTLTNPGLKK